MRTAIICFTVLLLAAPWVAAKRVALVGTGSGSAAKQAISLATAELSSQPGIELVDREAIDSVLREQKLSLSGLVDVGAMLKVGKLLKADCFAVVDSGSDDREAMGLVIFDTDTALRLVDQAIPANARQAATAIDKAVGAAIKKDQQINQGTQVVGFLPARNADLPADQDAFGQTVRTLLEREATASPGIAVLERSRLEQVNKERQLPTTRRSGPLRASIVMVQIEIGRATGGQGIKVAAILTSGAGQKLDKFEVTIPQPSAAEAADKLCKRLIESLKVQAVDQPVNRRDEARRFAMEADLLLGSRHFADGAAAAEAAFALQKNSDQNRLRLSTALWACAWECLTPDDVDLDDLDRGWSQALQTPSNVLDRALALATRALAMQQDSLTIRLSRPHDSYFMNDAGERPILLLDGFCARLNAVKDLGGRGAEFRKAAMQYVLQFYDEWGKSVQSSPAGLKDYNAEMLYALQCAASIAPSFADFVTARNHLVQQWLSSFDRAWPRAKDLWIEAGLRQSYVMRALVSLDWLSNSLWKDVDQNALRRSLKPLAEQLSHSSNPAMRLYAAIAADEAPDQAFKSFKNQLESVLAKPGPPTPKRTRAYAYIAAADAIHLLPSGTETSTDRAIHLISLAVRHRQLIPSTAFDLISDDVDTASSRAGPRGWASALESMLALSRASDCVVLDDNADGVRQQLVSEIHELRSQHPELGQEKLLKPWDIAKRLVDAQTLPGISRLEEFGCVLNGHFCFTGSGTDANGQQFLQGFDVPLSGGAPKPLAKVTVASVSEVDPGGDLIRLNEPSNKGSSDQLVAGSAVDDSNYFVSLRGQGVIVFPRDGSPAKRIDKDNGLPSNWTQSLASFADTLYIASSSDSGAYLIEWNKKDHVVKVHISSVRKRKKSPLDNLSAGLRIDFIAPDAPRNRLLLGVDQLSYVAGNWNVCKGGLWQLMLADGSMKQLLTVESDLDFGQYRGIDHDSLFTATTLWAVRYDLARDRGHYVNFKEGAVFQDPFREIHKKSAPKGTGWADPEYEQAGARRVIDGRLWAGDPFSRISSDGKTVEFMDSQIVADDPPIGPVSTMQPVEAGQLILGDNRQLFIVHLHDEH